MKTILVVGGAGYIGSHQVKKLDEKGFRVITYDNLSTGHREAVLAGEFIEGDLEDVESLKRVFEENEINAVMHFAANIEVGESVQNPSKYYRNNLANVLNLLDVMLEYNVKKFIFSSTAAVFGIPKSVPIKEYQEKDPISPYGKSKWMVERILRDYDYAYDMKYTILRYFNAAGADDSAEIGENHQPESHLIPIVLEAALGKREEIHIFGTDYNTKDGTCIRDYIHVNDIVNAHNKALERLLDGENSESFNLGSGKGYSVKEIIDKVKEISGQNFRIRKSNRRPGDPDRLVADSSKAQRILNWEPRYDLERIIQTAWDWHKKLNRKEN